MIPLSCRALRRAAACVEGPNTEPGADGATMAHSPHVQAGVTTHDTLPRLAPIHFAIAGPPARLAHFAATVASVGQAAESRPGHGHRAWSHGRCRIERASTARPRAVQLLAPAAACPVLLLAHRQYQHTQGEAPNRALPRDHAHARAAQDGVAACRVVGGRTERDTFTSTRRSPFLFSFFFSPAKRPLHSRPSNRSGRHSALS